MYSQLILLAVIESAFPTVVENRLEIENENKIVFLQNRLAAVEGTVAKLMAERVDIQNFINWNTIIQSELANDYYYKYYAPWVCVI